RALREVGAVSQTAPARCGGRDPRPARSPPGSEDHADDCLRAGGAAAACCPRSRGRRQATAATAGVPAVVRQAAMTRSAGFVFSAAGRASLIRSQSVCGGERVSMGSFRWANNAWSSSWRLLDALPRQLVTPPDISLGHLSLVRGTAGAVEWMPGVGAPHN